MKYNPRVLLAAVLSLLPGVAFAHSPIKGIGDFYAGLLHPVFVPAQLMLLLAVGFLFGQRIKEMGTPILTFMGATMLGLMATGFSMGINVEIGLLVASALAGLLVAANMRIPMYCYIIIGAFSGGVLGFDSAQENLSGMAKIVALLGSLVGIYLTLLYAMGFTDYFTKYPWQRIGIRVLGSWVAAISFLVLSLSLKKAGMTH